MGNEVCFFWVGRLCVCSLGCLPLVSGTHHHVGLGGHVLLVLIPSRTGNLSTLLDKAVRLSL